MMNTQRETILPSQDEESVFWICCCYTKSHKEVVQLQGRIKSPTSNSELGSAHPHTLVEEWNTAGGQGSKTQTDPPGPPLAALPVPSCLPHHRAAAHQNAAACGGFPTEKSQYGPLEPLEKPSRFPSNVIFPLLQLKRVSRLSKSLASKASSSNLFLKSICFAFHP